MAKQKCHFCWNKRTFAVPSILIHTGLLRFSWKLTFSQSAAFYFSLYDMFLGHFRNNQTLHNGNDITLCFLFNQSNYRVILNTVNQSGIPLASYSSYNEILFDCSHTNRQSYMSPNTTSLHVPLYHFLHFFPLQNNLTSPETGSQEDFQHLKWRHVKGMCMWGETQSKQGCYYDWLDSNWLAMAQRAQMSQPVPRARLPLQLLSWKSGTHAIYRCRPLDWPQFLFVLTKTSSTIKAPTSVSQTPRHPPESPESPPAYGSAAAAPPHAAGLHWTCLYLAKYKIMNGSFLHNILEDFCNHNSLD